MRVMTMRQKFRFLSLARDIAGKRNRALNVEGVDVARPRGTTVEKARVVLETTGEPALPIASEPDARLVASAANCLTTS
jgi:hypothetical protein